jgi:hypothetical protein
MRENAAAALLVQKYRAPPDDDRFRSRIRSEWTALLHPDRDPEIAQQKMKLVRAIMRGEQPKAPSKKKRRKFLTQAEVRRAVKAAESAGIPAGRVTYAPDGSLTIERGATPSMRTADHGDLDRELEEFEARHGKD